MGGAAGTHRRRRDGCPLIRDETGAVLTGAALWLPPDEASRTVTGEAVVDDTLLFDGEVTGVRIEPTTDAARPARPRADRPDCGRDGG